MAEKSKVEVVESANGDVSIGVTVDDVFVPFVTVDQVTLQDRIAAGKSDEAQTASGGSDGGSK